MNRKKKWSVSYALHFLVTYVVNKENKRIWSSNPFDSANDTMASGITRTNLRSLIVVYYIFSIAKYCSGKYGKHSVF